MNVVQTVITYTLFLPMLFGCGDMNTNTVELATTKNITNANYILQRVDGVWSAMSTGIGGPLVSISVDPSDGTVYAGGVFGSAGGDGDCNNVAKWDGTTWLPLDVGLNALVNVVAVASNGDLYVGGEFTDVFGGPGGTYPYLIMWDGSSWNAVGAGMNAKVTSLAFDSAGLLYIGGYFTDIDGGPGGTYNYICTWDGSSFAALGVGMDSNVLDLCVDTNDHCHAVGHFTTAGGNAAGRVAYWDGTTWQTPGSGATVQINSISCGPSDLIICSGHYSSISGVTANRIAEYHAMEGFGRWWEPMAGGIDAVALALLPIAPNEVYVGGGFTKASDLSIADQITLWNGSEWGALDIDFPGVATVYALAEHESKLYVGFNTSGTATTSGVPTTTVNHAGSARAFPTITIERNGGTTAVLESIQNLTTGKSLLFNHAMLDGEKIVIDVTPRNKTITTYVGDSVNNALNDLLPGSDFGTFALAPGDNDIALYISQTGAPTMTAFIQWQTTNPSIDGAP